MNKPFLTDVIEQYTPGGRIGRCRTLSGGYSTTNTAVDWQHPDGSQQTLVVRTYPNAAAKSEYGENAAKEYQLLSFLHSNGFKVPKPLLLYEADGLNQPAALLTTFIAGSTQIDPHDLNGALFAMADFLYQLHSLPIKNQLMPFLPALECPVTGSIKYLSELPEYTTDINKITGINTPNQGRCLLHGDFWPGNLLWNNHHLMAVIDWEDACCGSPLADVACCQAELSCAFGAPATAMFTKHYFTLSQTDDTDLTIWQVYVSSSALVNMADWNLPHEAEEQRRQATQLFLSQAISNM